MQPGKQSSDASLPRASAPAGILVMRPLNELRKHQAYIELNLMVSAGQLTALENLGTFSLKDPLLVTREGIVIDGYARRELAERQGISTLCCVEFDVDEDEALRRILNHHRRSSGWNDYNRIRMASELRTVARTRARSNQQAGGQFKGSSKLTEAEKVSVQREIANAAGVRVFIGNSWRRCRAAKFGSTEHGVGGRSPGNDNESNLGFIGSSETCGKKRKRSFLSTGWKCQILRSP